MELSAGRAKYWKLRLRPGFRSEKKATMTFVESVWNPLLSINDADSQEEGWRPLGKTKKKHWVCRLMEKYTTVRIFCQMLITPRKEISEDSFWWKYLPLGKIDQGSRDDWLLSHVEQQSGARQDNEATGKTSFVSSHWVSMNDFKGCQEFLSCQ